MPTHDVLRDRRWRELVGLLQDELDAVVDDFVTRVAGIEPYDREYVPYSVVRQDARVAFSHIIGLLVGDEPPPALLAAERVGADRARRQVPLTALMSAIRLDVSVLWNRLRAHMTADDLELVVERVEVLWQIVEGYSRDVQRSYLQEQSMMARERDDELSTVLTELLDGSGPSDLAERFVRLLGVEADAPLLVLAAPTERRDELWRWFRELLAVRHPVHWQTVGDDALLVSALDPDQARDLERGALPARVRALHCVVGPPTAGAGELAGSARLALRLSRVLPSDALGAHRIDDLWLALTRADLGEAALAFLSRSVVAPLLQLPDAERGRLLDTLRVYLDQGSVTETATRCYCHRNTVLNRLDRVRHLTGRDPSVPHDAALLTLCLPDATSHGTAGFRQKQPPA